MKGEKKEAKLSKMSLAARKAWETRRKNKGSVKPRDTGKIGEFNEDAEVIVEQLKRAYHKGQLVRKGKSGHRKSSVKMDEKWMAYLYGNDYLERVVVQKLARYARDLWGKLIFEGKVVQAPSVVVQR
jgi:hypothetical protein